MLSVAGGCHIGGCWRRCYHRVGDCGEVCLERNGEVLDFEEVMILKFNDYIIYSKQHSIHARSLGYLLHHAPKQKRLVNIMTYKYKAPDPLWLIIERLIARNTTTYIHIIISIIPQAPFMAIDNPIPSTTRFNRTLVRHPSMID